MSDGAFVYGDVINGQALMADGGSRVGGVNLTSLAFENAIPGAHHIYWSLQLLLYLPFLQFYLGLIMDYSHGNIYSEGGN